MRNWNLQSAAIAMFVSMTWGSNSPAIAQQPCDENSPRCSSVPVEVERGQRRPVIDGAGWVLAIPSKIMLWDRRALNHDVSDATVDEVATYLQRRQLTETKVRVNQYAPADEWRRSTHNDRVAPGWRYTLGSLSWLQYTLVPGRLFGRDQYNPYTNSLYLYSDMPTLGIVEAAYAKDIQQRTHPGTYAAVQGLPLVALWHETLATKEVVNYVALYGSSEQIEKVRHDLYARYGIETAGAVSQVLPEGGSLFAIVGAVSGHVTAASENNFRRTRRSVAVKADEHR